MKLWRPIGEQELGKIEASGMRAFPVTTRHEPIFFPVHSFEYADKIARSWNSVEEDYQFLKFIVMFSLTDKFLARYATQSACEGRYVEYWIPPEDLDEVNENIIGQIEVVAEYKKASRISRPVHAAIHDADLENVLLSA